MKKIFPLLLLLFVGVNNVYSQTIQGDQLLDLLNRNVSDQLFQKLKTQDKFITDALNNDYSEYIRIKDGVITQIELENGRLQSSGTRYGYYKNALPFNLNWSVTEKDLTARFGQPVDQSSKYNFTEYSYKNYRVKAYYEDGKTVSISFAKPGNTGLYPTSAPGTPLLNMSSSGQTTVNFTVLREIINSFPDLRSIVGKDSTDYIGQVYYSSKFPSVGFERTAVKRYKIKGQWWYEAFYKTSADTIEVQRTFAGLYQGMKATINLNAPDEFIMAAVTKDNFNQKSMNWLAQWTLNSNYTRFKQGLGKVKIMLMLVGMEDFLTKGKMNYTIKVYVMDRDVSIDQFTWDTPK